MSTPQRTDAGRIPGRGSSEPAPITEVHNVQAESRRRQADAADRPAQAATVAGRVEGSTDAGRAGEGSMSTPRNTSRETLREFVYVCVGCDCIDLSNRRDQMTCSTACRVRAHRAGTLRRLRDEAMRSEIRPASILQAAAVCRLDAAVADRVRHGALRLDDAQRLVRPAFFRLLADAADCAELRP
jgi:hypothetical protein